MMIRKTLKIDLIFLLFLYFFLQFYLQGKILIIFYIIREKTTITQIFLLIFENNINTLKKARIRKCQKNLAKYLINELKRNNAYHC